MGREFTVLRLQSTAHQRLLALARPVCTAILPARIAGITLRTFAFTSFCTSNFKVFDLTAIFGEGFEPSAEMIYNMYVQYLIKMRFKKDLVIIQGEFKEE